MCVSQVQSRNTRHAPCARGRYPTVVRPSDHGRWWRYEFDVDAWQASAVVSTRTARMGERYLQPRRSV
jgi:hypothetical protein